MESLVVSIWFKVGFRHETITKWTLIGNTAACHRPSVDRFLLRLFSDDVSRYYPECGAVHMHRASTQQYPTSPMLRWLEVKVTSIARVRLPMRRFALEARRHTMVERSVEWRTCSNEHFLDERTGQWKWIPSGTQRRKIVKEKLPFELSPCNCSSSALETSVCSQVALERVRGAECLLFQNDLLFIHLCVDEREQHCD